MLTQKEFESKYVNKIHCSDCLDAMKDWPDGVIDCCVTSPPYWGLRDYGVAGQLGLEKSPEEYVAKMVKVFREVRRVLKKEGTLWLNLGDSYNSSPAGANPGGFQGKQMRDKPEYNKAQTRAKIKGGYLSGLKPKDLCGIPWRVAFALQADGWWLRQDIIWHKPNPMPESVTDRCTKAHEYIFLLSKSPRYFYDADAIREKVGEPTRRAITFRNDRYVGNETFDNSAGFKDKIKAIDGEPSMAGRNKRSVWTVTTTPYSGAHFATFPPKLIEPCIKAGCPKQVCKKCGKARERIVKKIRKPTRSGHSQKTQDYNYDTQRHCTEVETTGWTSCNCNAGFRPGIAFDPFMGSGTVAEVAIKLKRDYVGIELNPDYIKLGRVYAAETGVPVKEQNIGQLALFEGK